MVVVSKAAITSLAVLNVFASQKRVMNLEMMEEHALVKYSLARKCLYDLFEFLFQILMNVEREHTTAILHFLKYVVTLKEVSNAYVRLDTVAMQLVSFVKVSTNYAY